jgi:ABC-type spermidine/putrescine transport system permease subunit II
LGLALLYVPIATLIGYSFVNPESRHTPMNSFLSLGAYQDLAHDTDLHEALWSSVMIGVMSASTAVIIGGLAAFGCRRNIGIVGRFIAGLTLVPLVVPEVVFGLGLLMWFVLLRISLGPISLTLAHVTFSVSYVFMTVSERARTLDPDLDDAASDLGASPSKIFLRVHLPLLAPALMAGWLMAFTLSFDDFLISFFTSGPDTNTLPIALYGMIKYGVSPVVFAASTVIFAVSFVIVTIIYRLTRTAR